MLEKTIEKKLTTAVKKAGGIAPKFVSPSFAGMPDRLLWSSIFVTLVAKKYHDSVTQLPSLHVG